MCDLDGTLLNSKSKLIFKTIRYIKKLKRKGHIFSLATGRCYESASKYINRLKPDISVCDNGGSIYFHKENKTILRAIDKTLFIDFVNEIREYLVAAFSQDFNNICIENEALIPAWCKDIIDKRPVARGNIEKIINHNPINPCLFVKASSLKECEEILKKEKYKRISYRYWEYKEYINIELYDALGTKGNALKFIHNKLNIPLSNNIAIGDEKNDIELIEASYNGTAMLNGSPLLKAKAKYVTKYDNNHNGAAKMINYILKKNGQ